MWSDSWWTFFLHTQGSLLSIRQRMLHFTWMDSWEQFRKETWHCGNVFFANISLASCFCSVCAVLTFLVRMNAFSVSSSLISALTFFSHLQFVECCLCWFYITSLRLPTIRFQRFERAGSPPLKLPLIPTMWQNTGLIKTPTWQELFLFFGMPAPRYKGVCFACKFAEVRGQRPECHWPSKDPSIILFTK